MDCPAYLALAPLHMECLGADMSAQGQGNGMMGINGQGGGPNMGMQQPNPGMPQMGQMPPQMGQMPPQMPQHMGLPPRQANQYYANEGGPVAPPGTFDGRPPMGGPLGPPMVDPNSAGGFFGHPGMGLRGGNVRQ